MILDHTKLVYQLQIPSSLCVTRSCIPPMAVIYIHSLVPLLVTLNKCGSLSDEQRLGEITGGISPNAREPHRQALQLRML